MTQIMWLDNLAPDIQEEILFLPRTTQGRDAIKEADIRPIVSVQRPDQVSLELRLAGVVGVC